jgi:hypothetical protein
MWNNPFESDLKLEFIIPSHICFTSDAAEVMLAPNPLHLFTPRKNLVEI